MNKLMREQILVQPLLDAVERDDSLDFYGRVLRVSGMIIEASLPNARVGATCQIMLDQEFSAGKSEDDALFAEVVALKEKSALMMPMGSWRGIRAGAKVKLLGSRSTVPVGRGCLGRVLDALGRPIDGKGPVSASGTMPLHAFAPSALLRQPVDEPLDLGVRAINATLTMAHGQRLAIAAGAGVGKSTLLGMMARNANVDVCVVALIGERGREVQEFVAEEIGAHEESAGRICVVASTSDEPPSMRLRAAYTATAIAEYYRDVMGLRVLLLLDSLTRVAMAQREIGLSTGELPAQRGYPPSAFALIPALLERAGMGERGAMTAVYTTLFDGGDEIDPISDAVRGTTDGHIILSRDLAERGIYPAIDIGRSISRVMRQVTERDHQELALDLRTILRDYEEVRELVNLGAYSRGANAAFDRALDLGQSVMEFIRQAPEEHVSLEQTLRALQQLLQPQRATPKPRQTPQASSGARAYKKL